MWRISTAIFMLFPIGCANANERTFDSSNPVHCMAIFSAAFTGAKQVSQPAVAEEMFNRLSFLAEQHGGAAWIKKITPQSQEIGKKMEAAHDERATIRLLDECVAQQNADPGFNATKIRK